MPKQKRTKEQEQRFQSDLKKLKEADELITSLLKDDAEQIDIIQLLIDLGLCLKAISWDETDPACIRNQHGYRNRALGKENKKNQQGAKIDFEALAHLEDLSLTDDFKHGQSIKSFLRGRPESLMQNLRVVHAQINFILDDHKQSVESFDIKPEANFLVGLSSYLHDAMAIKNLLRILREIHDQYQSVELSETINRYALGYLFAQLGESAKEVSDYIKLFDGSSITRDFFVKLGHYRQVIKNHPWVISGRDGIQAEWMLSKLFMALKPTIQYLEQLADELLPSGMGFEEVLSRYLSASLSKQIEKTNKNELLAAKEFLADGVTLIERTVKMLKEEIQKEEGVIQSCEVALSQCIEGRKEMAASAVVPRLALYQQYYFQLVEEKSAKQFHYLVPFCDDEFLAEQVMNGKLSDENRHIIFQAREKMGAQPADGKKANAVLKYIASLTLLLNTIVQDLKQDGFGRVNDYTTVCQWFDEMLPGKNYKVEHDLQEKLKTHQDILEKQRGRLRQLLGGFKMQEAPEETASKDEKKSPVVNILLMIVKEVELLQKLYLNIEAQRASSSLDKSELEKLYLAEKMAFGFLGESYKNLYKKFSDQIEANILYRSILSADCFQAIFIRHKQVLHNTMSCNSEVVHDAVKEKILPWHKEFQYLLYLATHDSDRPTASQFMPDDARILGRVDEFEGRSRQLFFDYTKIVALNRFQRSEDALAAFKVAKALVHDGVDAELAVEVYFQGSLAYRNLNQFNNAIKQLKRAMVYAKKIPLEALRYYKISGIQCDLAVAQVQIDQFDEARANLMAVTTGGKAADQQIIGANSLLAMLEISSDHEKKGRAMAELTLAKYFDQLDTLMPSMLIALLSALSSYYLGVFDLLAVRDLLVLFEEKIQEHFSKLVVQYGQWAAYFSAGHLDALLAYRLFEAVVNEDKQSLTDLSHRTKEYIERGQGIYYLTQTKPYALLLPQMQLLTGMDVEEMRQSPVIKSALSKDCLTHADCQEIAEAIKRVKLMCFFYYLVIHGTKEYLGEALSIDDCHDDLTESMTRLIGMMMGFAFAFFKANQLDLAKRFIEKTVLYAGLPEFFNSELNHISQIAANQFDAIVSLYRWTQSHQLNEPHFRRFLKRFIRDEGGRVLPTKRQYVADLREGFENPGRVNPALVKASELQLMVELGVTMMFKSNPEGTGLTTRILEAQPDQTFVLHDSEQVVVPPDVPGATPEFIFSAEFERNLRRAFRQ